MILGLWLMLGVCSFSVLGSYMRHCWCIFLYMNETMIWKEEESSRIRAVQIDNIKVLLGIKKMDKVPNPWIRDLCSDKRIDEGILRCYGHVERIESDRSAKRMYVGECAWCAGSCSVGQPRKKWIDTVKFCLKKKKRFGCQASKGNNVNRSESEL